ncbi:RHS repeat-associated core domain-containing protein [Embleya sp. NPDC005575]|uniref:RHS repeat-associated core domain-containing protein n=1 Tax=Embleya sp. NPDC005575 TaxID=3156892 RepID=UPI0033B948B6
MGWGILGDAVDAVGDGLDKAEDVVEAGAHKVGDAVDFVVDLAEATLDECMAVLKGLVSLGDEAVEQVVRFLGLPWPEADESKLRQMAGVYDRMAVALDQVTAGASPAARAIVAGNKGAPIDNFAAFWGRYDGGAAPWLPGMAGSCRQQADSLRKLADAVEKQKTVLKAEILAVAATILVGAGLLFVPGIGVLSGAAITAATNIARAAAMAAGLAISESVLAIIGSIVGSAVVGAVMSVTLDLAVAQPVKIALGAQNGITLDHVGTTAAYGAAGGAVGGTFSAGANALPKLALPTRLSSVAGKAPAALQSIPGQMVAGGGTVAIIDTITGTPITLADLAFGATAGAAGYRANTPASGAVPKGSRGPVDPVALNETGRPRSATTEAGDPVEVAAGKMVLPQTDVALPGALPWEMTRCHQSSYRHGRWFGRSWASWLDQHLELSGGQVVFTDSNGLVLHYPVPEAGTRVFPAAGPPLALAWDGLPGGVFAIAEQPTGVIRYFAAPANGSAEAGRDGLVLHLIAVADRNGNRIDVAYDPAGNPAEIRHSGGYRIGVETQHHRVICLRLHDTHPDTHLRDSDHPAGVVLMRYAYDVHGDLTEVVDSSGVPMRFTYDADGRVTSWTDRIGMSSSYVYDSSGRCVRTTGTDGVLDTRFTYDDETRTTTATNSLGQSTIYRYNAAYQITSETNALGNTTHTEWDDRNRLRTSTDPLGRVTRFTHDDRGNLTEIVRADGACTRVRFDDRDNPVEIVDPDGAVWRYEYDDRDDRVATVDPAGERTEYIRDAFGRVAVSTDALGGTRRYAYDAAGLPIEVIDPIGAGTRIERDAFGRPSSVVDPSGRTTRSGWTVEGKPTWREQAGAREEWAYDTEGNLLCHRDPAGNTTLHEVTYFDRVSARTDASGARYLFGYDSELRMTSVTNPHGQEWVYSYDAAGRLIGERDFNGRTLTYGFDAAGNLVHRANGAGEVIEIERDAAGRVARHVHTSTGRVTSYEYDRCGRLARATNPDVDLAFERDLPGRVTAEISNGRRLSNDYDALGRRIRRETPAGHVSTWSYDAAGRPTVLDSAGHTVVFGHDPVGRETERRFGDAVTLTQEWDAVGRLSAQILSRGEPVDRITEALNPLLGPDELHRRTYSYRADGFPTEIDDSRDGVRTFDLDPSGRVTAIHARNWTERYAYDAMGNITDAGWPDGGHEDGEAIQGERRCAGTLVRRVGRTRYEYDAQDRLVRKSRKTLSGRTKTWVFSWDADDRLVAVVVPDGGCWQYTYDALARRTAKKRIAPGESSGESYEFDWDGALLSAYTSKSGDSETWEYVPGTHRPVAAVLRTTPSAASSARAESSFHAIVADISGAPDALIGPDGTRSLAARGALWGQVVDHAGGPHVQLRFPGQFYDAETGLHQNFHRYYDPEVGGYISPDPLGLAPSPNPHGYVKNPLSLADPYGLSPYEPEGPKPSGARLGQERGDAYEKYLMDTLNGEKAFSSGGRQYDGAFVVEGSPRKTWYEAKSGGFWQLLQENAPRKAKFFSTEGQKLRIATDNDADFLIISENPIPAEFTDWFTRKGIPYTVIPWE